MSIRAVHACEGASSLKQGCTATCPACKVAVLLASGFSFLVQICVGACADVISGTLIPQPSATWAEALGPETSPLCPVDLMF